MLDGTCIQEMNYPTRLVINAFLFELNHFERDLVGLEKIKFSTSFHKISDLWFKRYALKHIFFCNGGN